MEGAPAGHPGNSVRPVTGGSGATENGSLSVSGGSSWLSSGKKGKAVDGSGPGPCGGSSGTRGGRGAAGSAISGRTSGGLRPAERLPGVKDSSIMNVRSFQWVYLTLCGKGNWVIKGANPLEKTGELPEQDGKRGLHPAY
ncbi:hypothetical protein CE91St42_21280 [Oscillospiraceae bacterium]|nr:hypothetical protein CE91St42_21280 [Oscillospiraceae bacterium]